MSTAIAKVFNTGNSQAVRLPKAFRVQAKEMWISKNEATGEITLKPKNDDERARQWQELLSLIEASPITEDFIPPRDDAPRPSPFEDWEEMPSPQTKRKTAVKVPRKAAPKSGK